MSTIADLLLANETLTRQRDEARALAWEYRFEIRQYAGEYQWEKHYAGDVQQYPWLPEKWEPLGLPAAAPSTAPGVEER